MSGDGVAAASGGAATLAAWALADTLAAVKAAASAAVEMPFFITGSLLLDGLRMREGRLAAASFPMVLGVANFVRHQQGFHRHILALEARELCDLVYTASDLQL